MASTAPKVLILLSAIVLSSCENMNSSYFSKNMLEKVFSSSNNDKSAAEPVYNSQAGNGKSLVNIVDRFAPKARFDSGFSKAISFALERDPTVAVAERELASAKTAVDLLSVKREFQVSSSIYGGIEDISDETAGLAVVLDARRLIYDGGKLDAKISSQKYTVSAYESALKATTNRRAAELAELCIELERFQKLNDQIESRLGILDPLIKQLETVAEAGLGNVSQVAAAQRTVAMIRVKQADVAEKLQMHRLKFQNAFGAIPEQSLFEESSLSAFIPETIVKDDFLQAPLLQMHYFEYRALEAEIASIEAKNEFDVTLDLRAQKPLGGSEKDSDESVGFILTKTLYNGNAFDLEMNQAVSNAEAKMAKITAVFNETKNIVEASGQSIRAMNLAISLARDNAKVSADEIAYLRRQLIIGESTLDSVLSAEARLYDAKATEINFIADRRKGQLGMLGSLGLLTTAFNL
jgi:outer membrane protein TolC